MKRTEWWLVLCQEVPVAPMVMCVNAAVPGQQVPFGTVARFDTERRKFERALRRRLQDDRN